MRRIRSPFVPLLACLICLFAPSARGQDKEPTPLPPTDTPKAGFFGDGYSMLPYYQEDAIIMHRSRGSFDAADMDWAAGPRIVFGIPLGEQLALEFGYFGLFNMNASAFLASPISTNVGGGIGTAINSRADYRSTVNNGELGLRYFLMPELSVLGGFRYLNWHENLNAAFDPVNPFAGMILPPGSATTTFHTSNNLYGFQTGANWTPMITDKLGINIGGKAGIFGAHTEMDATLTFPGFGSAATSASSTRTSFVGEFGILGIYNVTRYLNLRAGYQVMWIEGLALAPDQFNNANYGGSSSVSNRGGVFLHGAVLGLEYRW